jgi:hypothetical protein
VGFIDRQVDRAFRHRGDGRVVFGPSWGTAYIIRSREQELEVRDRMRRFTIGCWVFALGCVLLVLAGRFIENWLWIAAESLTVLQTAAIVRLVVMFSYCVTYAGWAWWSLRCLTAGLEPTPPSFSSRLQRAALHSTDGGLVLKASMGALVGIASPVVLISFRSIAWRDGSRSCDHRRRGAWILPLVSFADARAGSGTAEQGGCRRRPSRGHSVRSKRRDLAAAPEPERSAGESRQ